MVITIYIKIYHLSLPFHLSYNSDASDSKTHNRLVRHKTEDYTCNKVYFLCLVSGINL